MNRSIALALMLVLGGAHIASAQSVFSSRGLGVPVTPVDARARALGGLGLALSNQNPSLINPAEAATYGFRGLTAALQSSSNAIGYDGAEADAGANRFPLLRFVYPTGGRLVISAGYGGFLDQTWSAFSERTDVIGGETVAVRDAIDSSGGIAQIQVGAAYSLAPGFAIGVAGGLYTGELRRTITRTFPDGDFTGGTGFQEERSWTQRAPFATAGVLWDPAPILRVGGSVTWAGTLKADARTARTEDFDVDLPLQVAGGVSAVLAPRLLGTFSGRWSGWSSAADAFGADAAPVDTWELGGGIEWEGMTFGNRSMPLRLGYHYEQYPFQVDGVTPTESAFSVGTGLTVGISQAGTLASFDAAVERGSRDAKGTGLAEDFWRVTFSLGVSGL